MKKQVSELKKISALMPKLSADEASRFRLILQGACRWIGQDETDEMNPYQDVIALDQALALESRSDADHRWSVVFCPVHSAKEMVVRNHVTRERAEDIRSFLQEMFGYLSPRKNYLIDIREEK